MEVAEASAAEWIVSEPVAARFIPLARVLAGATAFNEDNVSDTYRGLIATTDGNQVSAIIKDLPPLELANEVLVAALGLALGLPIPQPYLALATPERFSASKGPEAEGGRLVFASTDVKQPSVRALALKIGQTNGAALADLVARVAAWARIGELYGLDELVANVDRNAGNLLFAGDNAIWLIDHGRAFTGPDWVLADLLPADKPIPGKLAEWLTPDLKSHQKTAAFGQVAGLSSAAAAVDLIGLAKDNYLDAILEEPLFDAVLAFLKERSISLPQLAATALAIDPVT